MIRNFPMNTWRRQRGAVLFVALVFLLLLTLLGVTASSTSILQERMTGGMRNAQLATWAPKAPCAAARSISGRLRRDLHTPTAASRLPPCGQPASSRAPISARTASPISACTSSARPSMARCVGAMARRRTAASSSGLSGDEATASLATQPRYMIEDLGLDTGGNGQGNMGGAILSGPSAGRAERSPLSRHGAQPGRHLDADARERKRVRSGLGHAKQSRRYRARTMKDQRIDGDQIMSAHQTHLRASFGCGIARRLVLALCSTVAWASGQPGDVDLSPTPPDLTASVDPNIVVTFDDSGSMASNFMGDIRPFDKGSWTGPGSAPARSIRA